MSGEGSVFDDLVTNLPSDERERLFQRLSEASQIGASPSIDPESPEGSEEGVEALYQRKGFWEHLLCSITAFFTHKRPIDVFEDRLLSGLRQRLESEYPGCVDFRRSALGPAFYQALVELKAAARYFHAACEVSVERDRPAFYAFLGSMRMAEIHERLLAETDLFSLGAANPFLDESTIFKQALSNMDEILSYLPEDKRRAMYEQVRALFDLQRLANYGFERFLASFQAPGGGRREAPFAMVMPLMTELCDALSALQDPPPVELIETMLLFPRQALVGHRQAELEEEMLEAMAKAKEALRAIQGFSRKVPLRQFIRAMQRNLSYQPKTGGGGENWFVLYKGFWKSHLDSGFATFARDRKKLRLKEELREYLGAQALGEFDNFSPEAQDGKITLRHGMAFSFIKAVFSSIFPDSLNRVLKLILIEGLFYKQDNRLEYTDAYNVLLKTPEALKGFDRSLAPDGELGGLFGEANRDFSSIAAKEHKRMAAQQAIAAEADILLSNLVRALRSIILLLKGIIHPESSGRYDGLQNISSIDGKSNSTFMRSIEKCRDSLDRFLTLLSTIIELDGLKTE